jgi:hypothetical protein
MRRLLVVPVLIAALTALTVAPTASADHDSRFGCLLVTDLSPREEVPPTASLARGIAFLRVDPSGDITFTVFIVNPQRDPIVAGHIHRGARGENGPVVVPLFSGMDSNLVFHQSDRVSADPALTAAICDDPAAYYVNYHTVRYPGGAVRGQLG